MNDCTVAKLSDKVLNSLRTLNVFRRAKLTP
jgi:hypothetical protein